MVKFPQTWHIYFLNSYHPSAHCLPLYLSTPLNQPCQAPGHFPCQIQGHSSLTSQLYSLCHLTLSARASETTVHWCLPLRPFLTRGFSKNLDWAPPSEAVLPRDPTCSTAMAHIKTALVLTLAEGLLMSMSTNLFNPHNNSEVIIIIIFVLKMKKLRHREIRKAAQGHTTASAGKRISMQVLQIFHH